MPPEFLILLIDDEPHIAEMLNRSAESDFPEATFLHVTSIPEATAYLNGLEGSGPRLILLDLNFQLGLSGFDFLEFFRTHTQGRYLPIVIFTSTDNRHEIHKAYLLGANAVTQKPFDLKAWKNYLRNLRLYWFDTVTVPELSFDVDLFKRRLL